MLSTFLEKSILATLIYYDVLDIPLTLLEIWRYRINLNKITKQQEDNENVSLFDISQALGESEFLKNHISQKNGFYFLNGRDKLYEKRIEAQKITDKKWKKFLRVCYLFQVVPFLKLVMVSGSLVFGNMRSESDLDILIIARHGRIWIVRTLTAILVAILGARRTKIKIADKICLNHFITDKSLEICHQSLYNAQNYARLISIMEFEKDCYNNFVEKNAWIRDYLVNYSKNIINHRKKISISRVLRIKARFLEFVFLGILGDWFEVILSKIESFRIKKDPRTYKKGGRVIFNDKELEFHPDSPEVVIINKYNKIMNSFGYSELVEKDSGLF